MAYPQHAVQYYPAPAPPAFAGPTVYAVSADPVHERVAAELAALDIAQKRSLDDTTARLVVLVKEEEQAGVRVGEADKQNAAAAAAAVEATKAASEAATARDEKKAQRAAAADRSAEADADAVAKRDALVAAAQERERARDASAAAVAAAETAAAAHADAAAASTRAEAELSAATAVAAERRAELQVLSERCVSRVRDEVADCQRREAAAATAVDGGAAGHFSCLSAAEERAVTAELRLRIAREKLVSAQMAKEAAVADTTRKGVDLIRARELVDSRRRESHAAMHHTESSLMPRSGSTTPEAASALGLSVVDAHKALSHAQCALSEAAAMHAAAEASAAEAAVAERRWHLDVTMAERELCDARAAREAAATASADDMSRREVYAKAKLHTQEMLRRLDALEAEASVAKAAADAAEAAVEKPAAVAAEARAVAEATHQVSVAAAAEAEKCVGELREAERAEADAAAASEAADAAATAARAALAAADAALEQAEAAHSHAEATRQAADAASEQAREDLAASQAALDASRALTKSQADVHAQQRSENLATEARRVAHASSPQRVRLLQPGAAPPPAPVTPPRVYAAPSPYPSPGAPSSSVGYVATPPPLMSSPPRNAAALTAGLRI
eukprot:TRINITY_DN1745_c0_g1_i1.p1 TRINITY_DN1745_c0_g1~~TRINITY_DN1745_c0_g1_i1.p1  ORF type:complete len:650 (+),score=347.65 TRINITY_DN1745_c0_g1_i1:79-1950(+)